MKEKKVLFALTTDSDVRIENSILAKYKQLYGKSFNYKKEYYNQGILQAFYENSDEQFDILVLNELLETEPFNLKFLDLLKEAGPNTRIIIVLGDTPNLEKTTKTLFKKGYYDCIFIKDLRVPDVAELIERPRNREEAQEYYGIEDDVSNNYIIEPEMLNHSLGVFYEADSNNICELYQLAKASYSKEQLIYLFEQLPSSVINLMNNNDCDIYNYLKIEKIDKKDKSYEVKDEKSNSMIKTKEKAHKKKKGFLESIFRRNKSYEGIENKINKDTIEKSKKNVAIGTIDSNEENIIETIDSDEEDNIKEDVVETIDSDKEDNGKKDIIETIDSDEKDNIKEDIIGTIDSDEEDNIKEDVIETIDSDEEKYIFTMENYDDIEVVYENESSNIIDKKELNISNLQEEEEKLKKNLEDKLQEEKNKIHIENEEKLSDFKNKLELDKKKEIEAIKIKLEEENVKKLEEERSKLISKNAEALKLVQESERRKEQSRLDREKNKKLKQYKQELEILATNKIKEHEDRLEKKYLDELSQEKVRLEDEYSQKEIELKKLLQKETNAKIQSLEENYNKEIEKYKKMLDDEKKKSLGADEYKKKLEEEKFNAIALETKKIHEENAKLIEEEKLKIAQIEEENKRKLAEEKQRIEEENKRKLEEERAKLKQFELEQKRIQEERLKALRLSEEKQRIEEENKRKLEEEKAKVKQFELEQKKIQEEKERLIEEERLKALRLSEEKQRIEEENKRKLEEEKAKVKQFELEQKRIQEEKERLIEEERLKALRLSEEKKHIEEENKRLLEEKTKQEALLEVQNEKYKALSKEKEVIKEVEVVKEIPKYIEKTVEVPVEKIVERQIEIFKSVTPTIDYKKVVAFVGGSANVGTTTIIELVAKFLSENCKKKVSIIDLSNNRDFFEKHIFSSNLRWEPYQYVLNGEDRPYKINSKCNLYTSSPTGEYLNLEYLNILRILDLAKSNSEIVLIDVDMNVDKIGMIYHLIDQLNIVISQELLNAKECSTKFDNLIKRGVLINHTKKLQFIINKYMESKKTFKTSTVVNSYIEVIDNHMDSNENRKLIDVSDCSIVTIPFNQEILINSYELAKVTINKDIFEDIKKLSFRVYPMQESDKNIKRKGLFTKLKL